MEPIYLNPSSFASQGNIQHKARLNKLKEKEIIYKTTFPKGCFSTGLTFNDVLLVPQYGQIESRSQCIVKSYFSRNIPLNLPLVSSPMDTVTEWRMAIQMAREGGLGIIHRFMTIEEQVKQIQSVKRSGVFVNPYPITIGASQTFKGVQKLSLQFNVKSFLVIDDSVEKPPHITSSPRALNKTKRNLVGILTQRDIQRSTSLDQEIRKYMTPLDKLIYYEVAQDFDSNQCDLNVVMTHCKRLLMDNKIEKVPLVKAGMVIAGLVSIKDIKQYESNHQANKNQIGRLFVGAAVGANKDYIERADALVEAGCDVLVLDIANGHSKLAINATQELKERHPTIDIVAGSIATGEGAENLIRSGADGVRCGIGNGSICITRIVAGCGVPQMAALIDSAPICSYYDIPLCSDGGNKNSGNMCKALALGANSIMVGKLVAGCEESPGVSFNKDGRFVKMFRGMAGLGANISKTVNMGGEINPQSFSAEGVQGYVPYMGSLHETLGKYGAGIRSGMSYVGAHNIKQLQEKARFVRITESGLKESNVHGITQIS